MYRISGGGSGASYSRVARGGKPSISKLKSTSVYLLDTGFEIYLWVGHDASTAIKASAFPCAQQYLKKYKRPPVLVIHRYNEGKEPDAFKAFFGPVEEGCACACVIA